MADSKTSAQPCWQPHCCSPLSPPSAVTRAVPPPSSQPVPQPSLAAFHLIQLLSAFATACSPRSLGPDTPGLLLLPPGCGLAGLHPKTPQRFHLGNQPLLGQLLGSAAMYHTPPLCVFQLSFTSKRQELLQPSSPSLIYSPLQASYHCVYAPSLQNMGIFCKMQNILQPLRISWLCIHLLQPGMLSAAGQSPFHSMGEAQSHLPRLQGLGVCHNLLHPTAPLQPRQAAASKTLILAASSSGQVLKTERGAQRDLFLPGTA